MSLWRRSLSYLGLAADEWDEHDPYEPRTQMAQAPVQQAVAPSAPMQSAPVHATSQPSPGEAEAGRVSSVRPVAAVPQNRAPAPSAAAPSGERAGAVIPMGRPTTAKVHRTAPTSFAEAKDVADHFKDEQPVVMDLRGVERDTARRLIDFASGLCYGLGGKMDKAASSVFMLTPAGVEISADDRRKLQELGLHDR